MTLTKKQFAEQIIRNFKEYNNINPKSLDEYVGYIYRSTSLGIALEVLGVITKEKYPEEFEYLSSRGGIYMIYDANIKGLLSGDGNRTTDPVIMTYREMFALLPNEESTDSYNFIKAL